LIVDEPRFEIDATTTPSRETSKELLSLLPVVPAGMFRPLVREHFLQIPQSPRSIATVEIDLGDVQKRARALEPDD